MNLPQPHDLLWINSALHLQSDEPLPDWVTSTWNASLPVVVRRDHAGTGLIPVGIRGSLRSQRAAAWIAPHHLVRAVTPYTLVEQLDYVTNFGWPDLAPIRLLQQLQNQTWSWRWGVTGSCGYSLATGQLQIKPTSDLDLLFLMPERPSPAELLPFLSWCDTANCRVDIQLETPRGGCALQEWLRGGQVLLKTNTGPVLVPDPWAEESS
jgi:phosphoribosyl-dephospho-CoA transferase